VILRGCSTGNLPVSLRTVDPAIWDVNLMQRVVLHVSPHSDDEAIAAGMTLAMLARSGWQVVNLLLSAGRPGQEERRRAEAAEAARRAGYRLDVAEPDALVTADACRRAVADAITRYRPGLLISPQPHDDHPGHERAGHAVRDELAERADPPTWWMWGLWAELATPTLYVPCAADDLAAALEVLTAYAGELARNDYSRLVKGRAASNAVLGSERIFGYGSSAASDLPFAELFTEAVRHDGRWYAGTLRLLDPAMPLGESAEPTESLRERLSDRST
jgi:LmbE family N-acetylglucosaminyl deacetylase